MKKSLFVRKAFLSLLVLLVTLATCPGGAVAAEKKVRVALVLAGFLGDKSFNDSAYAGLQRAEKDFGSMDGSTTSAM